MPLPTFFGMFCIQGLGPDDLVDHPALGGGLLHVVAGQVVGVGADLLEGCVVGAQ